MLPIKKIQEISGNIAELIRNPGESDSEKIMQLLSEIPNEKDYLRVHNYFGLMRLNKNTPFQDMTKWLRKVLSPEQIKDLKIKLNYNTTL